MSKIFLSGILLNIILSTTIFSQSIKVKINQNIINETYSPIEGIWEGTIEAGMYNNGKLLEKDPKPKKVEISFYRENGKIKGSADDNPKNSNIEITGDFQSGYIASKTNQKGFRYLRGQGMQPDKNTLILVEVHEPINNDLDIEYSLTYKLKKTYPLRHHFEAVIQNEKKRLLEEIENAPRSGTGFLISNDGHIVTNFHVIDKAKSITIRGLNRALTENLKVEVVQVDKVNDLAILKVVDNSFNPLNSIPIRISSSTSDVGEDVFILGYPLTATMGDEIKLMTGVISSKTGFMGNVSQYQISTPIQPGNSGGPLFNSYGDVIGIVSSKHLETENVGYAIKTSYLQNIIDLLPEDILTSNSNPLASKSLPEKVKVLQNYVCLVEVNNN